jgi:hypothetical protein
MPNGKIPGEFGTSCHGQAAPIISIDGAKISSGTMPGLPMREFC